jgi:hypothetical protein
MPYIIPPIPYDRPQNSFEWVDWFVKLRETISSIPTDHNTLTNIQGGDTNDYFHLKEVDYDAVVGPRVTKGTDTTDDLIVDDATNGLVLKDTQGTPHYWRVTVDNTGALVTTDLGTSKP